MTNWTADILTPWLGDGTDGNSCRPQIADDYALLKWEDITYQIREGPPPITPPAPNLYVVRVEVTALVLDAIQADPTYAVLSSAEIVEATP